MPSLLIPEEEKNVLAFCDNLKKFMLDALKEGRKVCIKFKSDTEPIYAGEYSAITKHPVDFVYHGQTISVCLGRPAALAISKHEAKMLRNGVIGAIYPGEEPQPDTIVGGAGQ